MGICLWSPRLDKYGNSVRGVQFCQDLVSLFNIHQYDNLRHSPYKKDPRKRKLVSTQSTDITQVLFAAYNGDIKEIMRSVLQNHLTILSICPSLRFFLNGFDLNSRDYDGRTALHIAGKNFTQILKETNKDKSSIGRSFRFGQISGRSVSSGHQNQGQMEQYRSG